MVQPFVMPSSKFSPSSTVRAAAAGSWIALVAATTLGDAAGALRAEVRADGLSDGGIYRLVVQSYDRSTGLVPGRHSRPVGSVQRAVTADELRQGVHVSLLEIRPVASAVASEEPLVLAWIEAGQPDLEFDGRTARPRPGNVYGVVKRPATRDMVQISLNRKVAA
jgi:hypothetical protein